MNAPPSNYEEALCSFQQDNKELREAQKRTETQLSNITELLTEFTNQMSFNQQPSSQPSSSSPLPLQPLPNPKGGINVVQTDGIEDKEDDWLYELLAKLGGEDGSDDEEDFGEDEEKDEEEEEVFFVKTLYGETKAVKEEIPEKCDNPGPCSMTCKIGE
ncbi:hypothetical protein PIB30_066120, partial [Stylosanthes scabra]|nr:hypothetical protein [Stylosanthes scabra]